jgi:hypothetical protein
MSYWIHLSLDGGSGVEFDIYDWNYTSNCRPMWLAAGVDLKDFDGKFASECVEQLNDVLIFMQAHPSVFKALNPENGWGDYNSLFHALRELYLKMYDAPNAKVRVSC